MQRRDAVLRCGAVLCCGVVLRCHIDERRAHSVLPHLDADVVDGAVVKEVK